MDKIIFDLVVIGGGPGGYVAAIRAAQLGMKVGLIEKEHLGGICLNWGCIPTKALLRSAEIQHLFNHAEDYGFVIKQQSFDMNKIVARSRKVAERLSMGVKHLLKKNKVQIIDGHAKFQSSSKIAVFNKKDQIAEVTASHIIIATGARPRILPGIEPDGKQVWTYKEALLPLTLPKSMLIVGSGAIGIEFASFYRTFGVDVTVVEIAPQILPVEDEEIAQLARKTFEKQSIKIMTNASLKNLKKSGHNITAVIDNQGKTVELIVEKVIMAVGIVGNVEDLGLEHTKVKIANNHIEVDKFCQTAEKGIYAIGDVAGAPWLAHKASHEAVLCVEYIAGIKNLHPLDMNLIPGCTYSIPQIASVGMTEKSALKAGYKIKVGKFPYVGNGKAIALGETEGLVKTIFDEKTGELLGAHMIGAEVTELIQGYTVAKTLETTEAELMQTIFPHPTLSEMMHEAVLDAYDQAIHI
ncbi:MAG: dihydrolipoyl dehydrogenase [Alphaproteobacteria bacterium]|nr:dihydrolipoyl dehydrogenase [Alphaproteobacteria bacterium]